MGEVTKPKNEGRVAAGKKLAEWNRKNKENLTKNKEQVSSSGEIPSSAPSGATGDHQKTAIPAISSQVLYGGVVLALGIAVFFLWKHKAPTQTPVTSPPPGDDIFKMD